MNTQIIVTLKLSIPITEIEDIDEKALIEFIKMELQVTSQMKANQFTNYTLSDFNPQIKDLWKNTKQLI